MPDNLVYYGGSFNRRDLPKVDISEPGYRDALVHEWYPEDINGNVGEPAKGAWVSRTSSAYFGIESTTLIKEEDGKRYLSLDGVTARVRGLFKMEAPYSVVAVMRMRTVKSQDQPIYPHSYGSQGLLEVDGTRWVYRDGYNRVYTDPETTVTTDKVVVSMGNDGNYSHLRVGNNIGYGKVGTGVLDGLTLGFANGNKRSELDIFRLMVFDSTLSVNARNKLFTDLSTEYGI